MKVLLLYLSLFISIASAQNLVPNADFEGNIGCANLIDSVTSAPPWFQIGNVRYFNVCSPCNNCQVPINLNASLGYQWPHSGDAYTGLNTFHALGNNLRAYVIAPLLDTLINDFEYCVEFYVNLGNNCKYASDAIGAYFSSTAPSCPGFSCLLNDTPQVSSTLGIPITDTLNWTKISGRFIAKGGERFISIGNFLPDNQLTISINDSTLLYSTYYYIDDVFVTLCDSSVTIKEIKSTAKASVFPNPSQGSININTNVELPFNFKIMDAQNRTVYSQVIHQNKSTVDISLLANGMYYYTIGQIGTSNIKGKLSIAK
jgi:hypothetical protein